MKKDDPKPSSQLYTLQVPSKLESIHLLENLIKELSDQYRIDTCTFANIMICLSELVVNAMKHGNKFDPEKKVYVNVEVVRGKHSIWTVADEGTGFPYDHIPDPTLSEKPSGRGIFIVKKLANQCVFNDIGNEVELHFKI